MRKAILERTTAIEKLQVELEVAKAEISRRSDDAQLRRRDHAEAVRRLQCNVMIFLKSVISPR